MRVRSFSHWVRMPAAFCRELSGKSASCSSCSAQPKISASGVRTSWLTPAIHWVRALSRRESISFLACSCAPVWFSFSASSPAKPSVGSRTVCPDVARRQSSLFGEPPSRELFRYAVHGLLHLAGEDDLTPEALASMRKAEQRLIDSAIAKGHKLDDFLR